MPCQAARISVMSPKNFTKVVWGIFVQLSSLLVAGYWLLAAGLLSPVTGSLSLGRPEARSQ